MRLFVIIVAMLLASCIEASYNFRGITNNSSCTSAVEAEQEQGSIFVGQEAVEGIDDLKDHVLEGTLYSVPVKVYVSCLNKSKVMSVNYVAEVESEAEAKQLHAAFEAKLAELHGQPKRSTLFHSSAYAADGKLRQSAKPWKHVSQWCKGDRVSVGVLSYLWHGEPPHYSVAVGADFTSITCE